MNFLVDISFFCSELATKVPVPRIGYLSLKRRCFSFVYSFYPLTQIRRFTNILDNIFQKFELFPFHIVSIPLVSYYPLSKTHLGLGLLLHPKIIFHRHMSIVKSGENPRHSNGLLANPIFHPSTKSAGHIKTPVKYGLKRRKSLVKSLNS